MYACGMRHGGGPPSPAAARHFRLCYRLLGEIGGRFENDHSGGHATLRKLQAALEARGVEFTNGKSPGVRLIAR
jgi:hypothetical protein